MRYVVVTRAVAVLAACAAVGSVVLAGPAHAAPAAPQAACALPDPGTAPQRSDPAAQRLDPAAVAGALAYAQTHLRLSVQIFRNNCLVGSGPVDAVTRNVPWNVWSSTKSVVSMATGIAAAQGKLDLDDAIGTYLPEEEGWGDAAHRAITIRNLLNQTSGLAEALLSEGATTGTDPHVARQALALPIIHEPGTTFEYSQRTPDLLAFVVAQAVGEDFQDYVQRTLFDPIGIAKDSYFWLRDRSGNTYGYAHLFIPSEQFARLGLLMQNGGNWNGTQVVPADYVDAVSVPTEPNPCYGMLFWTNRGETCKTTNVPNDRVLDHRLVESAPEDMYAMVGAFQQNNFVIPSRSMTVTWTGLLGDTAPDPQAIVSGTPGADLYHEFFRLLMRGVQDQEIPDPGPYVPDPIDPEFDPNNVLDPRILGNGLGIGPYAPPGCNILFCPPHDLTTGPRQTIPDVVGAVTGADPASG